MGRIYAGLLGLIAFLVAIAHGLAHAVDTQQTLGKASLALVIFAVLGYAAGELAGWIVLDSVRAKLAEEAREPASSAGRQGGTPPVRGQAATK